MANLTYNSYNVLLRVVKDPKEGPLYVGRIVAALFARCRKGRLNWPTVVKYLDYRPNQKTFFIEDDLKEFIYFLELNDNYSIAEMSIPWLAGYHGLTSWDCFRMAMDDYFELEQRG